MLRKSQICIVLSILFQLLVEINCQIVPLRPNQRSSHTATLINDKLYILGGTLKNGTDIKDFFYFDFSASFNTQNLPWVDLSSTNTIVPRHFGAASAKGGANNNTLIIYGRITSNPKIPSLYTFDTQSNLWSIPAIAEIPGNIPRKESTTGIIDQNGKLYLWGGLNGNTSLNDMYILDTINLIGGVGSLVGVPGPRCNYGAALLPDNKIIYMGGYNDEVKAELPLDQVYIYNTINNSWSTQTASGKVPSSRDGFSVILGLGGQSVIVFGGTATYSLQGLTTDDSIYELNLSNFEWIIPKISNNSQIPNSRMYHKANIIGKYMVISFGDGYDPLVESDILLLDISNKDEYSWTNTFDLVQSTTESNVINNGDIPLVIKLIGVIVGSLTLLTFGGFILYKWNKKIKRKRIIASIPHIMSDC
ncbi:hypothetical protein C1645_743361 [Glomus cerebriforme]|uniref:Galactose oxidase n=1 Tax=Glomus cerebriforme TaxID=658196 RepID=A0A397SKD8_9GLOM|nr:hypothetical protein C1645_743361 [Glomus cerebriforme]